ncbi:GGDEF domain-containing protein [Acinetobacter proteolyticus]|uniref:GGDEF domain-containing protein n=1 Tax=Acinetobacter proteolyticus TaxID=1776741 RepID=UPI001356F28B|nr:GGDEF domain-containing protein [Acinetobacter proteolyticus]
MNSINTQYFILIVPICIFFIGLAFICCRLIFKADIFLLWIGLAYAIPSIALLIQCLMSNPQLTIAAPFTAALYLFGGWVAAYAMSVKLNAPFRHLLALVFIGLTLVGLSYFSYLNPQIWLRLIILNMALGLIGLITVPAVFKQFPHSQSFDRWILILYLLNVLYYFFRALINLIFLNHINHDHINLTSSTWWLLWTSINILLNILFAIVISAGAIQDVIQRLNKERQYDPLTQVLNRRGFFEKCEKLIFTTQSYYLICLDIDHFKLINDTWGHNIGDQILQGISQIMLQHKNSNDLIARFGGEEFVYLISASNTSEALYRTNQLKKQLEQTTFTHHEIKMTASYGLTKIAHFHEIKSALQRADKLLYQAKENGRDQISFDLIT